MEPCELIKKLKEGEISPKEYLQLRLWLCYVTLKTGSSLDLVLKKEERTSLPENILKSICGEVPDCRKGSDCVEDLVSGIIAKLTPYFAKLTEMGTRQCRAYIYRTVKSHLVEAYRERKKRLAEPSLEDTLFYTEEGKEVSREEVVSSSLLTELLKNLPSEVLELVEDFEKSIPYGNLKYFCYLLLPEGKKLYKCLWGDKSEEAVYKDVSRKRKLVLDYLSSLNKAGYSMETVELFIKTYLSALCEFLRYKYCKEE